MGEKTAAGVNVLDKVIKNIKALVARKSAEGALVSYEIGEEWKKVRNNSADNITKGVYRRMKDETGLKKASLYNYSAVASTWDKAEFVAWLEKRGKDGKALGIYNFVDAMRAWPAPGEDASENDIAKAKNGRNAELQSVLDGKKKKTRTSAGVDGSIWRLSTMIDKATKLESDLDVLVKNPAKAEREHVQRLLKLEEDTVEKLQDLLKAMDKLEKAAQEKAAAKAAKSGTTQQAAAA